MKKAKTQPHTSRMQTFARLWKYLGRSRFLLLLTVLFALVTVALTLYVPILVGNAIDWMIGKDAVNFPAIFTILIKIAIAVAVTALMQWLMSVWNQKLTYRIVRDLRRDAFDHLQKMPISYLDSHSSGETVSRMITDVDQFADGLLMGLTQFATGIFTIIGTLAVMIFMDLTIAIAVFVLTPLSLLIAFFIARRTYHLFRAQSQVRAEQTSLMEEMVKERKTVSALCYEDTAKARFDEINDRLEKTSLRATFFSSLTNPSTRFVNALVYACVALLGAFRVMAGGVGFTVGDLSAFLNYANRYTKPFNEISGVMTELQNALACADRVFALLDAPTVTEDAPDAKVLTDAKGEVTFCDVSFSYTPEQSLLEKVNFQVKAGQRVAIVGPTGCGKTTLINLLMRFYDVKAGQILVDGIDCRDYTRTSLRQNYGMVLQETWLKRATVRENLKLGRPDATDEEMIETAKIAHAHSIISRLPKGYDTIIDDSAGILSQGEKQLLCIARMMLCRPQMLILDEATSSIDTRTEQKIQSAFTALMKGRTAFIVAHRLTTICDADLILVMRDGAIVEQGKHTALIAKQGFYYQLFQSRLQSAKEESEETEEKVG